MTNARLGLAVVIVCALTLGAGWIDGMASNRWGTPVDLDAAGEAIADVPAEFGDWRMESTAPLDPAAVAILQCTGHWSRTYVDVATGDTVEVSLIVGPSGPTAAHTPEVCMSSRDYTKLSGPAKCDFQESNGASASLWHSTYQSTGLDGGTVDVFYGWASEPDAWSAPSIPRLTYAGQPLLCKVQLSVSPATGREDGAAEKTAERFIKDFLPAIDPLVFVRPAHAGG